MAKKRNLKKKGVAKPPPLPMKYEDTNKFQAFDKMMKSNRGVRLD